MSKSKLVKANEKIAEKVVGTFEKIEDTVVSGYNKIEDTVVDVYKRQVHLFMTILQSPSMQAQRILTFLHLNLW